LRVLAGFEVSPVIMVLAQGPFRRAPSWRRRRKLARPPGPESRSAAFVIVMISIPDDAADAVPGALGDLWCWTQRSLPRVQRL
jgi:hypothetical protein